MIQGLLTGSLLRSGLLMLAVLVFPFLRMVSAFEPPGFDTDTLGLDPGQLDNFGLARFSDTNETSYSLIFQDRFAITVVRVPAGQSASDIESRAKKYLTISPWNTPDPVAAAGVLFSRVRIWKKDHAILVCEINKIYEGLTPVLMPYETNLEQFGQWLNTSSDHRALSTVVNMDQHRLLMVPLTFDPKTYRKLPGWITAEHSGSALQATEALNRQVLPGMSCLGQNNNGRFELMFLGIKPDREIYQYNKPEGEQVEQIVQIPFLPFETFVHLIATTAGISQAESNRWRYSGDGSVSLLALTSNDILDLFDWEPDYNHEGYLCQSDCAAGTAPFGAGYCRTRTGRYTSFYFLEGRLVEWEVIKNGDIPADVRYADAEPDCLAPRPLCFVTQAGATGFGEVVENKGCDIGNGEGIYNEYFVPIVISDGGAAADPEEPTLPVSNDTNSTEDYTGRSHVVVLTNPGFTEPNSLTPGENGQVPDLEPPSPKVNDESRVQIFSIAAAVPTAIVILAFSAAVSIYCFYRKSANANSGDEQTRLLEEPPSSPSPPPSPLPSFPGGEAGNTIALDTFDSVATSALPVRSGGNGPMAGLTVADDRVRTVLAEIETDDTEQMPPSLAEPVEGIILIPVDERHGDNRPKVTKTRVSGQD